MANNETVTFFVVERYINSELRYWAGRKSDVWPWAQDIGDAVRFADCNSASVVLAHLLNGCGRVAEHSFMAERQEPQP